MMKRHPIPSHPGPLLREDLLETLGLQVSRRPQPFHENCFVPATLPPPAS